MEDPPSCGWENIAVGGHVDLVLVLERLTLLLLRGHPLTLGVGIHGGLVSSMMNRASEFLRTSNC